MLSSTFSVFVQGPHVSGKIDTDEYITFMYGEKNAS